MILLNSLISARGSKLVLFAVQACVLSSAFAADGTYRNIASNQGNYSDSGNWVGGTPASGVDATATIDLENPTGSNLNTVFVNQSFTIGTLLVTNSGTLSRNMQLKGTGGSDVATRPVITFATTTGMPRLVFSSSTTTPVPQLSLSGTPGSASAWIIASTQGLYLDLGTSGVLSEQTSTSPWVSGYFSGPLVVARGTYTNTFTGAGGVPEVHLVVGDTANPSFSAAFQVQGTVNVQGIDGNSNGWLLAPTSGTVTFTQNAQTYRMQSFSTLTFGSGNDSGTFNGTVGRGQGEAATIFRSNLVLVKNGLGTQRFNGAMFNSGTTIINAGTLVINGAHTAVLNSGFSSYASLSVGSGGTYAVSGTLAGNGTIKPHETIGGGGAMIGVNAGGAISPGDGGVGTLTLDGSDSLSPLLNMGAGASFAIDVAGTSNADALSIINAQASDVTFHNNTLQMSVLPGFGAGTYSLFTADTANVFDGLTVSGSGVITAGLQLDSSFLSTYAGSTLSLVGNNIVLNAVGGSTGLTWAGPAGANWDHSTNSFTGSSGPTAFADGNAVTFSNVSVGTVQLVGNLQPSSVRVSNNAGTYVFAGNGSISGASSLTKSGAGTLIFQSGNAYTGGTVVSAGTLVAPRLSNGTLNIAGGTVQLTAKSTANSVFGTTVVPSLIIAAGGKLDLANNSLMIDYTSENGATLADGVRQQLADGRLSTTLSSNGEQLGYADNSTINVGVFSGVNVDSSSILILYTFGGDSNLDGKVNTLDFSNLAGSFGQTNKQWINGDFNYDALVNSQDFNSLVSNYGKSISVGGSPLLGTIVPEPASLALLALSASLLPRRQSTR